MVICKKVNDVILLYPLSNETTWYDHRKAYWFDDHSRLGKRCEADVGMIPDEYIFIDGGSERNFSQWMYNQPSWLKFPDLQDKVENNHVTKTQYGPTIERTWLYDEPIDNPEWMLRTSW